jgi:hypothetical protein
LFSFLFQIYFKLNNDLVIRSHRDQEVLELIPDFKLTSVLPRSLIREHVHWYNTNTHVVEIRPLSERWTPNLEKNWSTAFQPDGRPTLSRPQECGVRQFLIGPTHDLSCAIYDVLSPLEPNIFDLFITSRSSDHNIQPLTISLPRYNLSFAVTEQGELSCLSHRGFIVDSNEDIGTLYGLSNKLALCRPSKVGRERKIIIPIGSIKPSSTGADHPAVSIDVPSDAVSVGYRVYEVDELLGRLREATFSDRLYLLYLHALTSHQLVDPLTKRTGTEEALEGLKRAGSFSFHTLGHEETILLQCLGRLTPHRSLYSRQTKTMQTVQRHFTLPATLEHHDFAEAVQKIWSHWQTIRVFQPECQGRAQDREFLSGYKDEHQQLTRRAAKRNLFYAPSETDAPNSRAMDGNYTPRDCMREADSVHRETLAFEMAKLVQEWPANLDVTGQLLSDVQRWGGVDARQAKLALDDSGLWVDAPLRTVWRSLYDLCRAANKESDQSKLTFLLGTLAYRHPKERQLHSTLLAFATHPIFDQLAPPDSGVLDFSYGDAPTESQLRSFIDSNTIRFQESSEWAELDCLEWTPERDNAFRLRYGSRRQQQINECVTTLFQLRHDDHISPSDLFRFDLLERERLLSQVNDRLRHCYANR